MIDMRLDISRTLTKLPAYLDKLFRSRGEIERGVYDELVASAMEARNDIITSITNSPASNRGYKRGRKLHFSSRPGNPPRRDTGNMVASIQSIADEGVMAVEVGSLITGKVKGYPAWLEFGTQAIEPRPWLAPVFDSSVDRITERVVASAWDAVTNMDY